MVKKNKKNCPRLTAVYRIRNGKDYDRALVHRGSLTRWIGDDALEHWVDEGPTQQGAQFFYSDVAIETMRTLRELFHQTDRTIEGVRRSLFELLQLPLPVPDHTTLSRRGRTLRVSRPKPAQGP